MDTSHGGKVAKIEYIEPLSNWVGLYGTRQRRSQPDRERYDRKSLIRVSLVFSALSLVFILASVYLLFRNSGASSSRNGDASFAPSFMDGSASEFPISMTDSLIADDAVELVRAALQNRDPALVESFFIFGGAAATPEKIIDLLKRIEGEDGNPHGFDPLGARMTRGVVAEEVMVTSRKDGRDSHRLTQLLFVNGKWRIDLDSYVRHVSPSWEDILDRKCDVAIIRVFVNPDSYYNGNKYLEDRWKCYALISPDVDEILFGYAARNSVQEEAMDRIMAKEEEFHRAIIEVSITKEQGRKQFEISRVLADDWLAGDIHFDVSF